MDIEQIKKLIRDVPDFPKPGIVSVFCHLHPNMSATIVVAPTVKIALPAPKRVWLLFSTMPAFWLFVVPSPAMT